MKRSKTPSRLQITKLRAHHVVGLLYFEYLNTGKLPRTDISKRHLLILQYPLEIINEDDIHCQDCRTYPARNLCGIAKLTQFDNLSARLLGINIGRKYSAEELLEIFQTKARKQRIEVGVRRDPFDYMERFYGKNWKS